MAGAGAMLSGGVGTAKDLAGSGKGDALPFAWVYVGMLHVN